MKIFLVTDNEKGRILTSNLFFLEGIFFMYDIQHCFICRPLDSTVSKDAKIEPMTVATTALAVRRPNHSARSHPQTQLDIDKRIEVFFQILCQVYRE